MNKTTHPELYEDLSNIEDALIRLEPSADIWQNNIIKVICRTLYHILTYLIRKEQKRT